MPRELLTPKSEFWEKCARHTNSVTSRFVAHMFLCDGCATKLETECFNNRPPMFEGLAVEGYCGLCNKQGTTKLHQWFVCPICLNVVLSYPKGYAASSYVHKFWEKCIKPECPDLLLEETEPVRVESYTMPKRSAKTKAKTVEELDFRVSRDGTALFYIELKAGPTGIDDMKEFQLDVNDFNDIVTVYDRQCLPVYVFHVQINDEYMPPTRRSHAHGLWWTDIITLDESRKAIRQRRGEDKQAGYYAPGAFKTPKSFIEEMKNGGYKSLATRCGKRKINLIG